MPIYEVATAVSAGNAIIVGYGVSTAGFPQEGAGTQREGSSVCVCVCMCPPPPPDQEATAASPSQAQVLSHQPLSETSKCTTSLTFDFVCFFLFLLSICACACACVCFVLFNNDAMRSRSC